MEGETNADTPGGKFAGVVKATEPETPLDAGKVTLAAAFAGTLEITVPGGKVILLYGAGVV